jgi:hypothetical protein
MRQMIISEAHLVGKVLINYSKLSYLYTAFPRLKVSWGKAVLSELEIIKNVFRSLECLISNIL